MTATADHTRLN